MQRTVVVPERNLGMTMGLNPFLMAVRVWDGSCSIAGKLVIVRTTGPEHRTGLNWDIIEGHVPKMLVPVMGD